MGEESSGTVSLELTDLPDSILLEVLSYLNAACLGHLACTCSRFYWIIKDELLWKGIFHRRFKVRNDVPIYPSASSWRQEYRRLLDESPSVLCQELTDHKDQVLHVSFSHNGQMFATCSKDGKVMVWNSSSPCTRRFCANMLKEFRWRYTQFSQFNKTDTLLLVSGVFHGSMTTSGEIAVFDLREFEPQCRVVNKPYDVFGCWYDNHHLFSGSLYWTGHLQSISAIWLNKASQAVESERESVMMNLYRFSNVNASSIRTIMVADVPIISEDSCAEHALESEVTLETDSRLYTDDLPVDYSLNLNNNCEESTHNRVSEELKRSHTEHDQGAFAFNWEDEHNVESSVDCCKASCHSDSTQGNVDTGSWRQPVDSVALQGASSSEVHESVTHSPAKCACFRNGTEVQNIVNTIDSVPSSSVSADGRSLSCCCQAKDVDLVSRLGEDLRIPAAQGSASSSSVGTSNHQPENPSQVFHDSLSSDASSLCGHAPRHTSNIPRTTSSLRLRGQSLQTEKLLIFTMGEETYTPHLIGIKRMKLQDIRGEEEAAGRDNSEDNLLPNVDRNFQGMDRPPTKVDHTINMHGHIVGMALSPDQRYLYVNSRQWPQNYFIEKVLEPPPIAQEIDIHVIDLVTLQEVGTIMRSHKAFTPNDECFFLFLDVSQQYVASGAEDKRGYLWDRHYGVHLQCFPHEDVVNSVAFNPHDQEMLVTVSDDYKIKIWRSRRRARDCQKKERCRPAESVKNLSEHKLGQIEY